MPRVNRSGIATRARILEAAGAVLASQGVGGFTLQAVAEKADIRYGNLTHHFATRDVLVEAMFASLVDRYRQSFNDMATRARASGASVRAMVEWLLDDAVTDATAAVFLQLWAMAAHMPAIADGMRRLYDQAVDSFMEAHGVPPDGDAELRSALYLLGTVIEGSSAIFWTRDHTGDAFRANVRALAVETLSDLIERRLAAARAARQTPGT